MNRTHGRIAIRRPDSQPLTPAEILRTVGSSECADPDDPPRRHSLVLRALSVALTGVLVGVAIQLTR